jgi:eukaryotic-like serine/threonine-protein kinase
MSEPRVVRKRYRLGQRIDYGGMGEVCVAEDLEDSNDGRVTVKIIKYVDDITLERFRREAHALQVLKHPDIPAIRDHWVDECRENIMYLVMDYVPGPSLKRIMLRYGETGRLVPLEWAVALAAHVCSVLAYVHGQSIVHRDITPGNIMIYDGRAKLIDFGIMLDIQNDEKRLTGPQPLGTQIYIAPERYNGVEGPQGDMYSVGQVLAKLLQHRKPNDIAPWLGKLLSGIPEDRPNAQVAFEWFRSLLPNQIPQHLDLIGPDGTLLFPTLTTPP